MPTYDYICDDCLANAAREIGRELLDEELDALMFEVKHSMVATDKEVKAISKCPNCDGQNTKKTISASYHIRVRGHDWHTFRKENAGALQRDMALHQLQDEDPYGRYRQPGEASDLADRIRKAARKQSQAKVFDCGGGKKLSKKAK